MIRGSMRDRRSRSTEYSCPTKMQRPILIIEDDPDISESLKYNFEREGWLP